MQKRIIFLSLSGSGMGYSSGYDKGILAVLEGVGWVVCSRGCTKNAISASKLAGFLFTYLGLDWLGAPLVFIILLFLPF